MRHHATLGHVGYFLDVLVQIQSCSCSWVASTWWDWHWHCEIQKSLKSKSQRHTRFSFLSPACKGSMLRNRSSPNQAKCRRNSMIHPRIPENSWMLVVGEPQSNFHDLLPWLQFCLARTWPQNAAVSLTLGSARSGFVELSDISRGVLKASKAYTGLLGFQLQLWNDSDSYGLDLLDPFGPRWGPVSFPMKFHLLRTTNRTAIDQPLSPQRSSESQWRCAGWCHQWPMQEDHRGKEIDLEETVAVHTLEAMDPLEPACNGSRGRPGSTLCPWYCNGSSVAMLIAWNGLLHVKSKFSMSWLCLGMDHRSNHIKSIVSAIIFAYIRNNCPSSHAECPIFCTKVPIETGSGGECHEASSQALLGRPVAQGELGQVVTCIVMFSLWS